MLRSVCVRDGRLACVTRAFGPCVQITLMRQDKQDPSVTERSLHALCVYVHAIRCLV